MKPAEIKPCGENPHILIIGAGGIGCELVKSLAISGYNRITIVDFDTVSISNLSRQFFYSDDDVGLEKSIVLAKNAKRLFPNLEIEGRFMDILSEDFNHEFITQFDFIFCAVDNIRARARVSEQCLYHRILMVDCASSGKFAQSIPFIPFKSACYSCNPMVEPSGPKITCTIRSTPTSYEHCAAWAFHLFNSMYSHNESTDVIEVPEGVSVINAVFVERINELRSNDNMWKNRDPPNPLDITAPPSLEPISRPTDVWSDEESVAVFVALSEALKQPLVFDKDCQEHLAFAASSANLQARCFGITARSSMFDVKSMVSVVEPALATTNSIISGVSVDQMKKMICGDQKVKAIWMSHDPFGPRLTPTSLESPNPICPICGNELWEICCNFQNTNLSEIAKTVNVQAPSMVIGSSIVYDDEEGIDSTLANKNIASGSLIVITDLDNDIRPINVFVIDSEESSVVCIKKLEKVVQAENNSTDDEYSDIEVLGSNFD